MLVYVFLFAFDIDAVTHEVGERGIDKFYDLVEQRIGEYGSVGCCFAVGSRVVDRGIVCVVFIVGR